MEAVYLDLAVKIEHFLQETSSSNASSVRGEALEKLYQSTTKLLGCLKGTNEDKALINDGATDGRLPNVQLNGVKQSQEVPLVGAKEALQHEYTASDLNGLNKCLFNWCDSYDNRDWARLQSNVAPSIDLDYSALGLKRWPNMSPTEYIALVSSPDFVGNPLIMCQHLMGAGYWEPAPEDPENEAIGYHQIRAAHQVYTDETLKEVKLKGHAHASNVHRYRKVDGIWKLAGVKPRILWSEYDFENVWTAAKTNA